MNKVIGFLGDGQVGSGLRKVYKMYPGFEFRIKDVDRDDGLFKVDVLNVCIPYSGSFVDIVSKEIKKSKPKLTIIHSTLALGTTKQVIKRVSSRYPVVHSPIRGVHPNLDKGIRTFAKYIGGETPKARRLAKEHMESIGIRTKVLKNSLSTELGKLLDTTYYGIIIAWHGEMKEICDFYNVDFDEVVSDFNTTYNEGYRALGKPHVVRPVLSPPKEKTIGGHCVMPNAKILHNQGWDSDFLKALLMYREVKL